MILVETIIGNVSDPHWKHQLHGAALDVLSLDQWQAQKNRFRKNTDGGVELAVSLERNSHLHDGDILVWDAVAKKAVVTRIQLQEVLVIQISGLLAQQHEILARTCFELGHALGNQHWPAVVKGTKVYVPLTVDRKVMASVMRTHACADISYEFMPGTEVIPYLAPHESRRLFGGASATPHSHVHSVTAEDHDHGSGHSHEQSHDHQHGHVHTHDHKHPHDHQH